MENAFEENKAWLKGEWKREKAAIDLKIKAYVWK